MRSNLFRSHLFMCGFIVFFSTTLSISTTAQTKSVVANTTNKHYAPKALKEDFLIFRKALETMYPSLYRYADSVTINTYLDNQFGLLNKPMTETEFYKIIALSCARTNDEHLIPTPSPNYYTNRNTNKTSLFPFTFKIINRRFYVVKSAFSPSAIELGSELISINGRTVEELLNLLLPTIPSDGYIQTFNIRHLEDYTPTQNENLFDLNYRIFVEKVDSFRVEYIPHSNPSTKRTVVAATLTEKEYQKFYKERLILQAPLTFRYLKEDVAYLKITSFLKWHRESFKQDFDSLYQTIFSELKTKNIPHLILDLRNNEGGDYTGEELIAYLLKKPYRHFDYVEEKYVGFPSVSSHLENGKDLYFPDSIVYKTPTGNYRLKQEFCQRYIPLLLVQQPKDNHFNGQVIVLANGASGSMASVVCSFLKANQRAIFVGEETGGAMEGPTCLTYARLKLPNTQIRIEIPLTKTANALIYTKGRGVSPDYSIEPDIEDLLHGIDTELNFALRLINKK